MIFRLLILVSLVWGCTQEETRRASHESARPSPSPWSLGSPGDCEKDFQLYSYDTAICHFDASVATESDIMRAQTLLYSEDLLQNSSITSRNYFIHLLWQLNSAIETSMNPAFLEGFINAATRHCVGTDLRTCRNYSVLSRANNSYSLYLMYLADRTSQSNLELTFLLASFARNASGDMRLLQLFAQRSTDFDQSEDVRSVLAIEFRLHEAALNTVERNGIRQYLSAGRRNLKDVQTSTELQSYLAEAKESLGDLAILQKIRSIKNERAALFTSLNLNTTYTSKQENFFLLLDLIFWRYLVDRDEASALTRFFSEEEIISYTKIYYRLRLAAEIHDIDLMVKDIMGSLQSQTSQLLQKFYEDVDPIRRKWQIYKTSFQTLEDWLLLSLTSDENKQQIRTLNASLDVSIKTYSELPHNFYLALQLARRNFDSRLTFNGSDYFSFNALTIFSELINPQKMDSSWLRYTNDIRLLDVYLVKTALSFMLKSNLLDVVGENQEEFLQYFVRSMEHRYMDSHNRKMDRVRTFFSTSRRARDYFNFCENFEQQRPVERHIKFDKLRDGPLLATFDEKTFYSIGFSTADSLNGNSPNSNLMPFDLLEFPDLYEHAVTDTETVVQYYDLILESLSRVGKTSSLLSSERQRLLRRQSDLVTAFKDWNEMGDCMSKILVEERKIRDYILREEKKYLAQIYRDLVLLKNNPGALSQVRERYADTLFLDELKQRNVRSLDRISTGGYIYTRFDFVARMLHYLKGYSPQLRYEIELPETFDNTELYSYSAENKVTTFVNLFVTEDTTEASFIQSVLKLYGGTGRFTRWSNPDEAILDVYKAYIKGLAAQMRTGSVTIAEFFEQYEQFCDYFKTPEIYREIMEASGQTQTFRGIQFMNLFVDFNVAENIYTRIYGLFDTPYKYIMEDILGKDYYVKYMKDTPDVNYSTGSSQGIASYAMGRLGPRARAESFANSMKNLDKRLLLFPMETNLIEQEYLEIKRKLRQQEALQSEFRQTLADYDASDLRIDLTLDLVITEPKLSSAIVRNYQAEMRIFSQRTEGCFREDQNCLPQFLQNEIETAP